MTAQRTNVGILIFDDVEVLDFAGPFEVFSRTRTEPGPASRRTEDSAPFHAFTVASSHQPVTATGGLVVQPHFSFSDCPPIQILVVPGGFGTRPLLQDPETIEWISERAARAELTTSVCTGALLLARGGLLADRRATTHWGAYDTLSEIDPSIDVVRDARVVTDTVVTSAGVSAGIDMAFAVVETRCGKSVADETARYIEYRRG